MKNNPAFPGPSNTGFQIGMTKLEYFAINAPNEIPAFFRLICPKSKQNIPPFPDYDNAQTEEEKRQLRDWRDDPIYDLPPNLKWYQEEMEAHMTARATSSTEREIELYFQWRIFFAETLLKNINETIPKPVFDRREDKA